MAEKLAVVRYDLTGATPPHLKRHSQKHNPTKDLSKAVWPRPGRTENYAIRFCNAWFCL